MLHFFRTVLRADRALADGELLESYLRSRDDAAFEALVRRHGPMVWGVCRRALPHYHDAEDAFQATFLVLVRKAASVRPRELVAGWLYGVAHQTARKARATVARRRGREWQVAEMPEPTAAEPERWDELRPLLDQELSRLPQKFRAAVLLCDLEGKTRKEAARQLGVPEGTLAAWVARGRGMLARRLSRRGLALSGAAAAAALSRAAATGAVPHAVVCSTVKAAHLFWAGQAAAASPNAVALAEGVLRSMFLKRLKMIGCVLLAVAAAAGVLTAIGMLVPAGRANAQAAPPQVVPPVARPAAPPGFVLWTNTQALVERDGDTALRLRAQMPVGRFLKLQDADGKPVHIHEMVNWQPPPFSVKLADVRVYDTRGRAQPAGPWAKKLTGATLVLLEFRDGAVEAKQLAEGFRLYRDDLHVLVLPAAAFTALDSSKAFAPARSLPQTFPGAKPGGAVPPLKAPGQ
jgi:RNA polymerase sigma factor (sigma-70 family)